MSLTLSLSHALDLFLAEQSPSTARSYKYVLHAMQDYIGPARPLSAITAAHLLEFMQAVRDKPTVQSPATLNKYTKTIKTFFNWCLRHGFITPPSPATGIKRVKQHAAIDRDKSMPDYLYEQLLDYCKWDARYHALVLFIGDTGCRVGGAAGLKWSDIDFVERKAIVSEKGKPPRPVFFAEECAKALLRWRQVHTMRDGEYVFQRHGNRMNNDSLGQLFEKLCKRAGIGTWGPHSLRHRKGHQLADAKIPPSVASKALGHENVMTTLEYYYPKDWDRVQQAIEKLAYQSPDKNAKILKFREGNE